MAKKLTMEVPICSTCGQIVGHKEAYRHRTSNCCYATIRFVTRNKKATKKERMDAGTKTKSTDVMWKAVPGGRIDSNRRRH
jgi:hypothetical protein